MSRATTSRPVEEKCDCLDLYVIVYSIFASNQIKNKKSKGKSVNPSIPIFDSIKFRRK